MQDRHLNRKQYFTEQATTSTNFYIPYLQQYYSLNFSSKILEIGCGEGGNLLPFAQMGCSVTGIDISQNRITQAKAFFDEEGVNASFICQNFLEINAPQSDIDRYDVILIHDVIEHIEPDAKPDFISHVEKFLRHNGIMFWGFPAWQNPFGGHQQIITGFASKVPFIHLLPFPIYRWILHMSGASEEGINELMSIKRAKVSIEYFESVVSKCDYNMINRTLWFINPNYKQKFGLTPRRLWRVVASIPCLRNFFTTSAFYLLSHNSSK